MENSEMDLVEKNATESYFVDNENETTNLAETESPKTNTVDITHGAVKLENEVIQTSESKEPKPKKKRSLFRKNKKEKVTKEDADMAMEAVIDDDSKEAGEATVEDVVDMAGEISEQNKIEESPKKPVEEEKQHDKDIKVKKFSFRKSKKEKLNSSFTEQKNSKEDSDEVKETTAEDASAILVKEDIVEDNPEKPVEKEKHSDKETKTKRFSFRKLKKEKPSASFEPNDILIGENRVKETDDIEDIKIELSDEIKVEGNAEKQTCQDKPPLGNEIKLRKIWKRKSEKKVDTVEGESISTQTAEINPEAPLKDTGTAIDENELVPDESMKVVSEKETAPIKPPRKKSLINRLKKFNKANKSTDTNEEKESIFDESNAEQSVEDTNIEKQEDSFHDVFEEKCEDVAENKDGGIYTGSAEKATVAEECKEDIVLSLESNESDLTVVTILQDSARVDVDVASSSQDQNSSTNPFEISEDGVTDENECLLENVKEKRVTKNTVEEPKILDYVLVDHLNEKQKDESSILAIKALKVYRKARLNNAYCQACCSVM